MIGLEFEPLVPGDPKIEGETAIKTIYGMPLDHSKWWDLVALMALLIAHRVLFFLVLKYKVKLSCKLYVNTTFNYIAMKSSSLSNIKLFSCFKRSSQPLHSLSSQLGLRSPIRP